MIKSIKPDSQNAKLLLHLAQGKTISRLKAYHIYHIANLTARISELRDLCDSFTEANFEMIVGKIKTDPNGQTYEEYSMPIRQDRVIVGRYLQTLRRAA
jgi:hypothetical protein